MSQLRKAILGAAKEAYAMHASVFQYFPKTPEAYQGRILAKKMLNCVKCFVKKTVWNQ